MFDLEKEVDEWVNQSVGSGCFNKDVASEVKDHLYCEIEQNQMQGLSEQSAFWAATRRMGLSEDLKTEFSKNVESGCANETVLGKLTTKQIALLNAGFLVFMAVFVFGSAYTLGSENYNTYIAPISYALIFVPIIFGISRNQSRKECRMITRFFGRKA